MTRVVNFKKQPCDIKITRKPDGSIPDAPGFGYWGNPFKVETFGRELCIELYRVYFNFKIKNDPVFKQAIESLRGKTLGCFCKPLACHGDIIKEYLDKQ